MVTLRRYSDTGELQSTHNVQRNLSILRDDQVMYQVEIECELRNKQTTYSMQVIAWETKFRQHKEYERSLPPLSLLTLR